MELAETACIATEISPSDPVYNLLVCSVRYECELVMYDRISPWNSLDSSSYSVPESPGMPVTGSPSMLKGYHNSLIDGSPLRRALHDRANE